MSLKDRLTRLTGDAAKPALSVPTPKQDKTSELRRKINRIMDRREQRAPAFIPITKRDVMPLEHVVIGEEMQTPYGKFFVSRKKMNAGAVHGNGRISDFVNMNMEATAFLAGFEITYNILLSDGLFLDTETTGLMGGTGTFPFLIGLGWFEGSSFVTYQLFARDFSEEGAVLRYLIEITSGKKFLVTFNGKAYDLNLLNTRFILNRCQDTLTNKPQIDLLHLSRRLLAHRLENARLSTIETHILGVERNSDIPGFQIPQRYFDWLRLRDGKLLEDVFIHNRLDVVSLAALLKYMADLFEDTGQLWHKNHNDLLKLAGFIYERGDIEKAGRVLETLVSSHHMDVATDAQKLLSIIYKRSKRWEDAASLWLNLVESNPYDFFAVEELAKFYEHHTRECRKALRIVTNLLNEKVNLSDIERTAAEYRLHRLLGKVSI